MASSHKSDTICFVKDEKVKSSYLTQRLKIPAALQEANTQNYVPSELILLTISHT